MRERGQLQLAMCALHLSAGHTTHCKQIKAAIVEQCECVLPLRSCLDSLAWISERMILPTNTWDISWCLSVEISRSLIQFPIDESPALALCICLLGRKVAKHSPLTLIPSLMDGFKLGHCAGHRLSKQAQPAGKSSPVSPQLNHLVSAPIQTEAIVPVDVKCQTCSCGCGRGLELLAHPSVPLTAFGSSFEPRRMVNTVKTSCFLGIQILVDFALLLLSVVLWSDSRSYNSLTPVCKKTPHHHQCIGILVASK